MKTHQDTFIPSFDTVTRNTELQSFAQQLLDISTAASNVRAHLKKYARDDGNVMLKRQAEALRIWMDINNEGLRVAARAAELGPDWADDIKTRLEAAARDLQRLEKDEALRAKGESDPHAEITQVCNEVNAALDTMEALYATPSVIPGGLEKVAEQAGALAR